MRYFSVCSGIEAATVAWSPLGFTAAAFSEVEPFPCAVLAHHYPEVPNLGDMTRINGATYRGLVDILVGGTPCQAFSVAGLRQGLEDARGNLTLTFLELANAIDPAFVVWENVPGVLSDKTNAFGCLLGGLVGADNALENVGGWPNCGVVRGPRRTAAWRVLDAQYFGLAQRRQRVFLVACPRNGADPAEVLFERQGVQRHSAPSRETGQGFAHDVAPCLRARSNASHRLDTEAAVACITGPVTHALKAEGFDASEDGTGGCAFQLELQNQGSGGNRGFAHMDEPGFTMNTAGPQGVVCFGGNNTGANGHGVSDEMAHTLDRAQGQAVIAFEPGVMSRCGGHHYEDVSGCLRKAPGDNQMAVMTLAILGRGEESNLEIRQDGTANALRCGGGGGDKPHVLAFTGQEPETLLCKGIKHGGSYASSQEAYAGEVLRALREEVGEEAFAQWGLGVLGSFLQEEVLRQAVHGCGLRLPARSRDWLVYNALAREEDRAERVMLTLREAGCGGRASQGWRPSEQLLRELGAYMSKLSQPGASAAQVMRDLWSATEGPGVLREALSAVQEVGRPACCEGQSAYSMQVRRLTCEECEFLQGFPRNYTLIPWKNKPAEVCPDGPRYKALGNSMAVPCMRWIGERIKAEARRVGLQERALLHLLATVGE